MLRKGDEPIPGYRLEKFLGRGQYGEVWQAIAPGTRAALKFIDLSGKHGLKELRGITRVKEIRHPHLMPITAMWMLDESGNILSNEAFDSVDRLEGISTAPDTQATLAISQSVRPHMLIVAMLLGKKNLEDRLKEAKDAGEAGIPVAELLVYMEEAAKGIDFLNRPQHDLGEGLVSIQHCDIKPANIMLMGDAAVVCDFGLARILGSNLQATATGMVGSPAYMSPESIRRKPSLGSDQYSLAISYAELRTGRLPFYDETYAAVLLAHENGTLKLDYLPAAEAAVIRRATALSPAGRFPSCAAMVEALRAAVGTSPVLLQPVVEPDEPVRETLEKSSGAPSRETVVKRSTAREFRSPRESTSRQRPRSWLAPVIATSALAVLCLGVVVAWKLIPKWFPAEIIPAVVGNGVGKAQLGPDVPTLLAEAGKHWTEGRLPESVAAYEQIIKATRKPKTPAESAARVTAQVGLLRASLRADSPPWDEIAKDARKLLEPDSKLSPAQRGVVRLAQVLAAVHANSESILANMTLRDLAELQQHASQLEEPEQRLVDDLRARALRELSAAEKLDEATLAQVAAIWPGDVRLTLLLPRLRSALDASDWPAFQATLALAQPLANSAEEQGEVAALELQSHLADPAASFPAALEELSRVAEMKVPVASWDEVCERIAARCENESALTSQVLAAMGKLKGSLAAELQPSANACWQRLARGVLLNMNRRDALPLPELTQLCVDYQTENPDDPLVNAVWVECQLRAVEPGAEMARAQWTELEGTMRVAVAASDKLPSASDVAYVRLVSELLHGRATLSPVRDAAADALLAVRKESPELFQDPWRRRMTIDLLLAAARRQGIPSDLDLPGDADPTPSEKAWELLVAGYQLDRPASDELIAAMIVAGQHQKLDDRQRQWLVSEAARLLPEDDSARTKRLQQQNLAAQLPLAASRLNADLWSEKRDVQNLRAALRLAARALRPVFDPLRSGKFMSDVKLYRQFLAPLRPLLDAAESAQLNDVKDKQALAELWGALGQLMLRDISVARTLEDATQAEPLAHDALRRAAELEPRAVFFVGQALALMQLPDDGEQERLKQLEDLWQKAFELDPNSPGVHNLNGYLLTMKSRRQTSREASLELLEKAIKAFKRAVDQRDNDDFTSDYWEGLSAANLEAAFYSPRLVKRPFLIAAESAAQTALKFSNRRKPWEAYLKLGNAYEDQAHYLYEKTFPQALAAFQEAHLQATGRGSAAHAAVALFSLGRARARYAASDDIRSDEITSELELAESDLREAINTWEKMPEKKGTQTQIAQARHFISELLSTKMDRTLRANDPARIDLAIAAMKESELAAAAAWKARSSIWPLCQLSLVERTKTLALLYPKGGPQWESWRRKAVEQAQAIIREFESPSLGFQLSLDNLESALHALLTLVLNVEEQIELVHLHLDKFPDDHESGSELRFAFAADLVRSILIEHESKRKKYIGLCEQYLEWMEKLAQNLEDSESGRLLTGQVLELRARLAIVDTADSDANKLQKVVDTLEKSLEAYSNHRIEESVASRFMLAETVYRQLQKGHLFGVRKKVVAQRVLDVLKPIEMRHVSKKEHWTVIEQYRQAMEAILKESSGG